MKSKCSHEDMQLCYRYLPSYRPADYPFLFIFAFRVSPISSQVATTAKYNCGSEVSDIAILVHFWDKNTYMFL
jgi:hypothetical protein